MAVTRRTSAARKSAPKATKGTLPTFTLNGAVVPDIHQLRLDGVKWYDIEPAVAKEFAGREDIKLKSLAVLGYRIELAKNPKLKIPLTAEAIAKARAEGLRWQVIAVRAGKGEAVVKKLYEEATTNAAETHYVGKGRRFPAMVGGEKPVGYKSSYVQTETGEWVPAGKGSTNGAAPKRTARKAKTATSATPKRTVRRAAKPAAE